MDRASAYDKQLADMPTESPEIADLERQRTAAAAPLDPTQNQYKPTISQRIMRGIGAFARGGVLGVADPSLVGQSYSAPSSKFALDSQRQAAQVGTLDQQLSAAQGIWKDRMEGIRARSTAARARAAQFGDLAKVYKDVAGNQTPLDPKQQVFQALTGAGVAPEEALRRITAAEQQQHAESLPQQLLVAETNGDTAGAQRINHVIRETQVNPKIEVHQGEAGPGNTGTWTPGYDAQKNPVLFNSKTGEVKPFQQGFSKTLPAANGKPAGKLGPDEQKRADLAENFNENANALEEIAKRRPDLFGMVNGRMTELHMKLGTKDPDITRLKAIRHNLGMASQSAHGMRSAQGVESAAASLLNYHDSPEALLAGIEQGRNSVKTFQNDSEAPGQARPAPAATAGAAAVQTATGPNGHKILSRDGGNTWLDAQTGQEVR